MRIKLLVEVPASVDTNTLAALQGAANKQHGITISTSQGVSMDVDLLAVMPEREVTT